MEKERHPGGRPTMYSEELVAELLDDIAHTHLPNVDVCNSKDHYPAVKTMYQWRTLNPEFADRYARAKQQQVEARVENLITETYDDSQDFKEVAPGRYQCNNAYANRLRVRAGIIQWYAAKKDAANFGEKRLEDKMDSVREELRDMRNSVEKSRDKL